MDGCEKCGKYHKTEHHDQVLAAVEAQDKSVAAERALRDERGIWKPDSKCQVCGELHPTHSCCEKCNYDRHQCHFCGDHLAHDEVSTCYILLEQGIE